MSSTSEFYYNINISKRQFQSPGGTEIVIQGNYFNPLAANNAVTINGVRLTVVEWSRRTLKVKIPAGIKPGLYPISITVSTQTAVSAGQFEIK